MAKEPVPFPFQPNLTAIEGWLVRFPGLTKKHIQAYIKTLTTPEALCRDMKDGCIVLQGIVKDEALADRVSSMFVTGYMRLKKVVESDSEDEEEDDDEDYEGENTEHGEEDEDDDDYSDRWSDA